MTPELNETIQSLERLLVNDLGSTFEELRKILIPQDDAWDSMVLMEARYNDIKINILRGTVSEDQTSRQTNKVREDLLHFIQALKNKDLVGYEPTEEATSYEGHLLYKIPLTMSHNEKSSCLVRIAIEKSAITKYLEMNDGVKQSGLEKVSDVMQVELLDPSMSDAFKIQGFNDPEQLILKKGYTEWRFEVMPLKSGVFPLLLKVAVLILVNGKERKREITLEKEINVTTVNVEKKEIEFVTSDVKLNMGGTSTLAAPIRKDLESIVMTNPTAAPLPSRSPSVAAPAPTAPRSTTSGGSRNFRKIATGLSAVLLLAVGSFVIYNQTESDSNQTGTIVKVQPPVKIELATPENIFGVENEGGEHFASVELPPVFDVVTKRVPIENTNTHRTTSVPTQSKTITKKVLIPDSDPPRYETRTYVIDAPKPATVDKIEYKDVIDTVEIKPLRMEKRPVLGGPDVTPELLKSIQLKMKEEGYDVGQPEDSQATVNEKFKTALFKYQKNNALPVGNLDFETLKNLGVDYRK